MVSTLSFIIYGLAVILGGYAVYLKRVQDEEIAAFRFLLLSIVLFIIGAFV